MKKVNEQLNTLPLGVERILNHSVFEFSSIRNTIIIYNNEEIKDIIVVEMPTNEVFNVLFIFGRVIENKDDPTKDMWVLIANYHVYVKDSNLFRLSNGVLYYDSRPFCSFQFSDISGWGHHLAMLDLIKPPTDFNKLIVTCNQPKEVIETIIRKLGLELVYVEDNKLVFRNYQPQLQQIVNPNNFPNHFPGFHNLTPGFQRQSNDLVNLIVIIGN